MDPIHSRGWGKATAQRWLLGVALLRGEHVHTVTLRGTTCEGGDADCPMWEKQLQALLTEPADEP
ncbi:hypothetical protein [Streptomyces griseus]|uniref:hypothetical protein n=1 Tax=Streptomyces griseus TaxID=1911 RepID=UPI0033D4FBC4